MSKIFISHSSSNNPEALAISQWLEDNGWSDFFLDITPALGLSPGERWQESLKAAAHRCEVVLFLISQPWLDSKWCLAEFLLAKNLGKNIFGILIEDLDIDTLPVEMKGEYQLCNLVQGDERTFFEVKHDPLVPQTQVEFSKSALNSLKNGLNKSWLDAKSFPWPPKDDPNRSPYRGLKPLEGKDAAVYFGRDSEIVRGLDDLRKLRDLGLNKILVILGASGSGKSSFLRAGLLTRLKRDDRHFISLPIIRPGRDALNGELGLVASLEEAFNTYEIIKTRYQIRTLLEQQDGFEGLLLELRSVAMKTQGKNALIPTILISIDQCEELYSADTQATQILRNYLGKVLLSNPIQSSNSQSKLHVIALVTIRTELYDKLQIDTSFSSIQQQLLNLTPLSPSQYKEIIEGPAEQATNGGNKLEIEPALTSRLLMDTKGVDALPLLAFTLEHLLIDHGSDGDLTEDKYISVGGIQGAVKLAINAALSKPGSNPVIPSDKLKQKQLLRSAFIPWLVEIDENTGDHKRRIAKWDEIPVDAQPLLERLINLRLLTRDKRKIAEEKQEEIIIEVAHEALLRQWETLVLWLKEDLDVLRITSTVIKSTREWINHQENDEYLVHTGERLLEAKELLTRKDLKLRLEKAGARNYINQCSQYEREQIENEKRQIEKISEEQNKTYKYQKKMSCILVFVSLLTVGVGFWVYKQFLVNSEQVSKILINESKDATKVNKKQNALKLALLATQENWRSKAALNSINNLAGMAQILPLEIVLEAHTDIIYKANFNPAGTLIVTASADGTARLWDAISGKSVGEPLHHGDSVVHASFNSAGTRIVTASDDKTARIWDITNGKPVGEPLRHEKGVVHASFNPAGTHIVTASDDKTARIWDATSGKPVGESLLHENWVVHASFNSAGTHIVTASADRTARIWDATSGKQMGRPLRHEWQVLYASFNPAGDQIVTASSDKTARIWDATSGMQVGDPLRHEGSVLHASFNPAGTRIVTVSEDNTARIWDATNGKQLGDPLRHERSIYHARFNPSGTRVVTASGDNNARIWDASRGKFLNHKKGVVHASFNPAGAQCH